MLDIVKSDLPSCEWLVLGAVGIVTGISVLGGLLVSRGVTNNPPLEVLRGG